MSTAVYQKEWYWRNRERVLAANRERYHTEPEYRLLKLQQKATYKKEHKGEVDLRDALYRRTHKDEIKVRNAVSYKKRDSEKEATRRAVYYQQHRDVIRQRVKQWAKAHPEKVRQYATVKNPLRRAYRLGLPGHLTLEQWRAIKVAYKGKCAYCGKRTKRLTIEHVIPISKGGGTLPDNIVPACYSCNSSKGNREPILMPAIRLLV